MTNATQLDLSRAALLVVDLQPDFMPGGALGVADGDHIIAPIRSLMRAGLFPLQVATQDWHPPGHISFASRHAGKQPFDTIELYGHEQTLWPDHCVQGSEGARLHGDLDLTPVAAFVRKGMDPHVDSYSGFRNNWSPEGKRPATGLAGYLRDRGIDTVFCCGLARDVCVKWTAQDAADCGFKTFFLWDLTRSVDPDNDDKVSEDLSAKGARIITCDELPIDSAGL